MNPTALGSLEGKRKQDQNCFKTFGVTLIQTYEPVMNLTKVWRLEDSSKHFYGTMLDIPRLNKRLNKQIDNTY